jgi:hypothetical protein
MEIIWREMAASSMKRDKNIMSRGTDAQVSRHGVYLRRRRWNILVKILLIPFAHTWLDLAARWELLSPGRLNVPALSHCENTLIRSKRASRRRHSSGPLIRIKCNFGARDIKTRAGNLGSEQRILFRFKQISSLSISRERKRERPLALAVNKLWEMLFLYILLCFARNVVCPSSRSLCFRCLCCALFALLSIPAMRPPNNRRACALAACCSSWLNFPLTFEYMGLSV